jgi:hypothetical protein
MAFLCTTCGKYWRSPFMLQRRVPDHCFASWREPYANRSNYSGRAAATTHCAYGTIALRRLMKPTPTSPRAKRDSVAGSGTFQVQVSCVYWK